MEGKKEGGTDPVKFQFQRATNKLQYVCSKYYMGHMNNF